MEHLRGKKHQTAWDCIPKQWRDLQVQKVIAIVEVIRYENHLGDGTLTLVAV